MIDELLAAASGSPTLDKTAADTARAERSGVASAKLSDAAARNDEAAMVSELASMIEAPGYLQSTFRAMSGSRSYVFRDCMLVNSQDTVAVNHVVRNQMVSLAYLGVADPQPFCQPARRVGKLVDRNTELFAETMEIHLSQQASFMRLGAYIEGAAQDASTNGYAVLKVTLQDDFTKDPIGRARFGDMQEQVAEYQRLKALVDQGAIVEGTAEHQRYRDVEQSLRVFVAGKIQEEIEQNPVLVPTPVPVVDPMTGVPAIDPYTMQPITQMQMLPDPTDSRAMERQAIVNGEPVDLLGLPILPHFRGFVADAVLPEDYRWDWRVVRPEDWATCEWQAHRVFMTDAEIRAKWKISDDEFARIVRPQHQGKSGGLTHQSNSTDQDPALRTDIEAQQVNDTVAVWEVWHRPTFRRYVFVEGIPRLLANEAPQAVGRRFFPFFHVYFTRVSGRVIPLSDVEMVRGLQDEVNMLRTHDREARRSSYPVLFMPKGLLSKGDMEKYRNRLPFSIIEVDRAEEVSKYFTETEPIAYDPRLFDTAAAESQMQQMFGLPLVVTGANSGENLASALALAKEGMETGVARRRIQVNRVLTEIFQWVAEISLKVFDLDHLRQQCGEQAMWPQLTIDQLYTNLRIEVKGGLEGQPRSKDRLDLWANFAAIAQQLALPVNGFAVLPELLDAMGLRIDPSRLLGVAPPSVVPGGTPPAPSRGQGPDGGAPLMVDPQRGAPDSLEQIPNGPLS